ncbi:hypothetical protein K431DRAFT_247890 [Polychaeton citri CBS 116435]|uniref:Ribosomal protein S35, mitochondrial n=1 Tax=Polychaeton citri CBS 116435 TaxID=1314669 RepID=A0A9P4QAE1_9PEZI|nr:hypothetical protein K431DRAFT_247890 [Polychaeton citri CBS 116435]
MPPRIHTGRLPQQVPAQCVPSSQCVKAAQHGPARSFHASSRAQTRLRRSMYGWLNGPGAVFREPMKGSTNYLGAYDKSGKLARLRLLKRDAEENAEDEGSKELETEASIVQQEIDQGVSDEEREIRAEQRAVARQEAQGGANGENPMPKERRSDLRPYPLNSNFRSQRVLSEELREEVYRLVAVKGEAVSAISARLGIDMRRVAAVVRLKTIEKQWIDEGKKLATPYSQSVLDMLPKTPLVRGVRHPYPHEDINDLPVHPRTRAQLFYPTSESRQFTREDAAKVFDSSLLPADKRIAHPQLIQYEKWALEDLPREDQQARREKIEQKEKAQKEEREREEAAWKERTIRSVPGRRWDFVFQDISAENVGKDGRGRQGVGYRYGVPHQDRKRGLIKIPTRVE